ncbi:oxidoreductase [Companilactobacillus sp. RD055328]|uniref:SDR family NAD(P)-dependent oxidoreductase n=1 Tax=Companilactobacillus sp. RD055328 TaxID=2916634 RepID=UPI001FC8E810|nr:SDR family NAD(P)-dependent oxidoreductase [Companilactobacillus sp. RD055328]GKQ42765.1 oxidoreductase [Companilactobacillus sp. RD055328]
MKDLMNKTVVITGASSGIGRAVAIQSVQRGAKVILLARNLDKLNEVKDICNQIWANSATVYQLDIQDTDNLDEVVTNIDQVDVLLNAAGFGDFSKNYVDTDFADIKDVFNTNVLGLMYMSRVIASKMIEQGFGHIINIGSMAGKIPTAKATAYAATKAAVIAFSDGLRLELKPFNVQVTSVNPGPVDTNFFGMADPSGNYITNLQKMPMSDMLFLKPDQLALEIVNAFGTHKREINRPRIMAVASVLYKVAPEIGDYLTDKFGDIK